MNSATGKTSPELTAFRPELRQDKKKGCRKANVPNGKAASASAAEIEFSPYSP
jgi:hypothetical protein